MERDTLHKHRQQYRHASGMSIISSVIFLFFEFHISKIRAGQLRICMSRRIAKKNIAQLALQIRLAGVGTSSLYILFKSLAWIQKSLRMHGHGKWDAFFIPYHAEKPYNIIQKLYVIWQLYAIILVKMI
jgi:hypothetical protein